MVQQLQELSKGADGKVRPDVLANLEQTRARLKLGHADASEQVGSTLQNAHMREQWQKAGILRGNGSAQNIPTDYTEDPSPSWVDRARAGTLSGKIYKSSNGDVVHLGSFDKEAAQDFYDHYTVQGQKESILRQLQAKQAARRNSGG